MSAQISTCGIESWQDGIMPEICNDSLNNVSNIGFIISFATS